MKVILFLLCCVTVAVGGCSRGQPVAPAAGTVKVEGQPLTMGRVMFLPQGGGPPAMGQVDESGQFLLTTYRKNDGALVGSHRVTIIAGVDPKDDDAKRTVYQPPGEFILEVKANTKNHYDLEISRSNGWKGYQDS